MLPELYVDGQSGGGWMDLALPVSILYTCMRATAEAAVRALDRTDEL